MTEKYQQKHGRSKSSEENVKVHLPAELRTALRKICEEIDARAEFEKQPASKTVEARILLKLAAYERICVDNDIPPALTPHGTIDRDIAFRAIRHLGAKRTNPIQQALVEMTTRHGRGKRERHDPEREIDRILDAYEEDKVKPRGYGPPRLATQPSRVSRAATAGDVPCDVALIDNVAMIRLARMAKDYPPGEIAYGEGQGRKARRKENPALARLLRNELRRLRDGLPDDPLVPGTVDTITVCRGAGIGIPDLRADVDLRRMIEAARIDAPLVSHPILAMRRYTYANLIAWARDAEREPAEPNDGGTKHSDIVDLPRLDPGVASRKHVMALRDYIAQLGPREGEDAPVPYDLMERIETAMRSHHGEFEHGWRGLLKPWIVWNDLYRATMPVPDSFALTFRILCREANTSPAELDREFPSETGIARIWAEDMAIPSAGAERLVRLVAARLRVPYELFVRNIDARWRKRILDIDTDMFPQAGRHLPLDFEMIEGDPEKEAILAENHWRFVRQQTVYSQRLKLMLADPYGLPKAKWNTHMLATFEASLPPDQGEADGPLRSVDAGLRERDANGKIKRQPRPMREATKTFKAHLLTHFFGYLNRPRIIEEENRELSSAELALRVPVKPVDEDEEPVELIGFEREGGLGIPVDLIKPGILPIVKLCRHFAHWKTRRSGLYVRTIPLTFFEVARMLRPGSGVVWQDPNMLADMVALKAWLDEHPLETEDGDLRFDIQPFIDGWQVAVAHSYDLLMDDFNLAMESELVSTRDGFTAVGAFVNNERPMELWMKGVRVMLAAKPHSALSRHVHVRNSVCTLIEGQTGLRAYNMVFTYDDGDGFPAKRRRGKGGKVLPPTIRKVTDKEGAIKWVIRIPAGEFKNWYSPFFKGKVKAERPYIKTLKDEDGLYALFEEYVTKSRLYMLRGRKSDHFFISSKGHDMSEEGLSNAYKNSVGYYFIYNPGVNEEGIVGVMRHGLHGVRHIRATHIVKTTGDIYLAAWSIQDAPRTVEIHYAKFMPNDRSEHAERVLEEARAVGRSTTAYDGLTRDAA